MNHPDISLLPSIFCQYPEIQAVYLFGSSARDGSRHAESDLDLAIVPRSSSLRERKLEILTDLARLGFDDVDLVFLDSDDIVLKYEAVKLNEVIYAAPDFDRGSYFSLILRQYFDFAPYLEVQRQAYKRNILSGQ